jgi:hypothetical protein
MVAWWRRGSEMPTVEERLTYLEGREGQQSPSSADLQASIGHVRADVFDLRGEMRDLLNEVRTDIRDLRGEMSDLRGQMNRRFEAVDHKFTWLIGIQVTMLVMMAGALFGLYFC